MGSDNVRLEGLSIYKDGRLVSSDLVIWFEADPAFAFDYYADRNGVIKAVVVRPSSEEERGENKGTTSNTPDPAS